MPVEKVCVVCFKKFSVPPCRELTATTCSNGCAVSVRAKSRERKAPCKCKVCGKDFERPRSVAVNTVYCSYECKYSDAEVNRTNGERRKGANNPMWKGGVVERHDGYLYERCSDHPLAHNGYVLQHRLVMERWLIETDPSNGFLISINGTKYLSAGIEVHHVDENIKNNDRSNLVACTKHTHKLIHAGHGANRGTFWPEDCGIEIDDVSPAVRQADRRREKRRKKNSLLTAAKLL